MNKILREHDFFIRYELVEYGLEQQAGGIAEEARLYLLAAHARHQRVGFVKSLDGGSHGRRRIVEGFRGHDNQWVLAKHSRTARFHQLGDTFARTSRHHAPTSRQFGQIYRLQAGFIDDGHQLVIRRSFLEGAQSLENRFIAPPMLLRPRIKDLAATNREHWRVLANDETIAR